MAIRPGPPIAQLGLDSDVTKPVALNRDQAWIVSAFLRAGAASLEQMPLRSTDACGAIHRAEQCEFARRVADDLDGWRGAGRDTVTEAAVWARWAALVADAKSDASNGERVCVECGVALPAQEGPGRPRVRCESVECARAFWRRRARAYYEANKDEIAEKQRAYCEANKDEIAEKKRAYYEANKATGPLVRVCFSCGEEFTQERRKAHPFMRCEKCRAHKGDQP